jgi:hypothetical protein
MAINREQYLRSFSCPKDTRGIVFSPQRFAAALGIGLRGDDHFAAAASEPIVEKSPMRAGESELAHNAFFAVV